MFSIIYTNMSHSVLFYLITAVIVTEYLTGFVKNASIIRSIRIYVRGKHKLLDELLVCGYCLSIWLSLITTLVSYFYYDFLRELQWISIIYLCIITCSLSNFWHDLKDRHFSRYKDKRFYQDWEFENNE